MAVGQTGVVVDPGDISVRVDGTDIVVNGMTSAKLQLVADDAAYSLIKVGEIFPLSPELRDTCGSLSGMGDIVQLKVTELPTGSDREYMGYSGLNAEGETLATCHGCITVGSLTKIKLEINQMQNIPLVEKAKLASKTEPLKSFIKLGVTNSDGLLTAEGQQLFLGWLLAQQGDAFKTAVIDPILEFEKSEAKQD